MRTPDGRRRLGGFTVLTILAGAAAVFAVAGGRERSEPAPPRVSPVAWQGLVGEPRTQVATGQLSLVLLKGPSLADRVAAAGGLASDGEERRWTAATLAAQKLIISRLSVQGARIRPVFNFTRVVNAFAAPLDPRAIALLERAPDVGGIYPVRAAYPASTAPTALSGQSVVAGWSSSPDVRLPGFDGRGVTIALLDTGVDRAQPYLRGRVQEGVDIVGGSDLAVPASKPDDASELERHGTEVAGIVVGLGGPSGLSGIAPGASILPIRVAGWQRAATGEWAVYSRTDQLIAGLERAVDPNDDGDAHDAARIALVGVAEPYAAFADGPLARAAAGAMRLDTLVIAAAGNDGPAGPGFGSVSGPGGAPAALTVGAADVRRHSDRTRVVLRAGLEPVLDGLLPLAGAVAPERPVTLALAAPKLPAPQASAGDQAVALTLADFFDEQGFSRVAGKAALVPAGDDAPAAARAAARAGAAAVVLFGQRLPAGALGLDERAPVPVVAVPEAVGRTMLTALERGVSTDVSIGAPAAQARTGSDAVAAFSSRGLAFDGRVKPELTAPGVGIPTSEPGAHEDGSPRFGTIHGSSAAAAVTAGAAALLAQARPELGASTLKSLLVGSARRLADARVAAQGAGLVDVGAAAAAQVATHPATLAFGRAVRRGWASRRRVVVRNLSARTLRVAVTIERRGFPAADTFITARPARLIIPPGALARVRIEARVPQPARGGPAAEGALVLTPAAGVRFRIPFAVAFGPAQTNLLEGIELSTGSFAPSDTRPSVLSLQAGRVRTVGGTSEVQPVERLDIELWTGDGKRIGVIARLRDLLPGRYAFGITGRDPGGQRLKAGVYRLRLVAVPTGDGLATRRSLKFAIT
jgi:subtilisin family serine protease